MKDNDRPQSSKMKATFSPLHPPKSMTMSKNRGTPSKAEKKKSLVAIRLAMLQQDIDTISSEEQLTLEPAFKPLTPIKSTNIEGVHQSRGKSSRPEPSAMKQAEEFQATLSSEHPSLIRYMLHSHVASCFWLGLNKTFCQKHFPTLDTMMELIDESGKSFYVKYLAAKVAFSGGWRGFAVGHNLEEGDVVVFQLVKKATVKAYIIRRNAMGDPNGAIGHQDLDASADVMISNDGEENQKIPSGSTDNEGIDSNVLDRIGLSKSKSVNLEGSVSIDAKFPDGIRRKYYDLCTNQKSLLHKNLLKGLNSTLVAGIITETVNITDAIRACDCNTEVPRSDLLAWDRTLQSFQQVGMNVHFIRAQIHQLLGRALEREEAAASEAREESEIVGERMKALEVKLLELRKQREEIDEEIGMMQESTKRSRVKLQQMTSSSCGGFGPSFAD